MPTPCVTRDTILTKVNIWCVLRSVWLMHFHSAYEWSLRICVARASVELKLKIAIAGARCGDTVSYSCACQQLFTMYRGGGGGGQSEVLACGLDPLRLLDALPPPPLPIPTPYNPPPPMGGTVTWPKTHRKH